ncbi:VPLPA-CTERM sorting domain-containing protein [Rubellimicrobium arenae]|uniref:VPLPA-CTERM sorting domain-containing protein n=1 Tax=Rubellimicrobium arenae TaxID=2817372 RepID=UPI001B305869|nr:VPLPA-CTERM sorting domain-containing protein [Rubellimicrobium arenae]
MKTLVLAAGTSLALMATAATAATVDFTGAGNQGGGSYTEDGFQFDDVRIVSGNCPGDAPCGALNPNETSTLTSVMGSVFDLTSLAVTIVGNSPAVLELTTDFGSFQIDTDGVFDFASNALFQGISFLTFDNVTDKGNIRFDNIEIAEGPAPIPLPAGAVLLGTALVGLGAVRRRRNA